MKIFLFGSHTVKKLYTEVFFEINEMIKAGAEFIVGDCGGADAEFQKYLTALGYQSVTVYHMSNKPRNNHGNFATRRVVNPENLSGRAYYTQKDIAMVNACNQALCVWDGKSTGTRQNLNSLRKLNKNYYLCFYKND